MKADKDMTIAQLVSIDQAIAPFLMENGMHCLGCALAHGETIEEACYVHGIDCDSLLNIINEYLEAKGE